MHFSLHFTVHSHFRCIAYRNRANKKKGKNLKTKHSLRASETENRAADFRNLSLGLGGAAGIQGPLFEEPPPHTTHLPNQTEPNRTKAYLNPTARQLPFLKTFKVFL